MKVSAPTLRKSSAVQTNWFEGFATRRGCHRPLRVDDHGRRADRSHLLRRIAAGFVATGEPAVVASEPLASRNGKLTVTPAKNGPLLVQGNVEVVTGTGHTVNRVVKTALCRCGHSANKPYCDGTHAKVGFTSE